MKVALVGAELEENLALRYMDASLARAGHETRIFDFHAAHQTAAVAAAVAAWRPDVVGLSMVFTARAMEFVHLAEVLRAAGWAGHLVAGGHFAALNAADLLRDFPALDSVVHGEGEEAMVDLLANLAQPERVPGLTCRVAAGCIVRTPPRPNPDDLDSRPWPTRPEWFHTYLGLPIANMLAGRGCFAHCHFCSISAWHRQNPGKRFRQRAVEAVAAEMAHLYHARGVRLFNFHDDNFFLPDARQNLERFRALKRRLDGLGVGRIGIQVKARPDSVRLDVVEALMALGLFRVFLGVESAAVAGLKALGRGITREQNHEALRLLRGRDLHTTFNLLMFEPDTTLSDLRDNIAFMRQWAEAPMNFCRTEVYAGTALEERLRAEGRLRGGYFGRAYHIADLRVQRAFEIVRRVFSPRQFDEDGMNLQAMKIEYHGKLLKHFWPERARPEVHARVRDLIRRLNTHSADSLGAICDFVAARDVTDARAVESFAAEMGEERADFDAHLLTQANDILADIHRLAAETSRPRRSRMAQAATAAAAALLVTAIGCATEMAPRPAGDTKPLPKEPPKTEAPPAEAEAELAPEQAAAVQARVRATYQQAVTDLAKKHSIYGKTVRARLGLDASGHVASVQFLNSAEVPNVPFLTGLTGMMLGWTFPDINRAGFGVVSVETLKGSPPAEPPSDGGAHMFEMAPGPRD